MKWAIYRRIATKSEMDIGRIVYVVSIEGKRLYLTFDAENLAFVSGARMDKFAAAADRHHRMEILDVIRQDATR